MSPPGAPDRLVRTRKFERFESADGQDKGDHGDDGGEHQAFDAADPDCAALRTIGQRTFMDVGTASGSPELAVRVGLSATSVDADARIGMLEVGIEDASLRIGSNEDEDATAGTCNDGADDDSDGADVDDDDCAFISVDFTKTGDGRLTIEDLFDTMGGSPPSGGSLATNLSANLDATVPVEATLGGAPLVGGSILVTGEFDGPLTSAADFVSSIEVDASAPASGCSRTSSRVIQPPPGPVEKRQTGSRLLAAFHERGVVRSPSAWPSRRRQPANPVSETLTVDFGACQREPRSKSHTPAGPPWQETVHRCGDCRARVFYGLANYLTEPSAWCIREPREGEK